MNGSRRRDERPRQRQARPPCPCSGILRLAAARARQLAPFAAAIGYIQLMRSFRPASACARSRCARWFRRCRHMPVRPCEAASAPVQTSPTLTTPTTPTQTTPTQTTRRRRRRRFPRPSVRCSGRSPPTCARRRRQRRPRDRHEHRSDAVLSIARRRPGCRPRSRSCTRPRPRCSSLAPTPRLRTSVLGVGSLSTKGVWNGTLYLRGGGDPTFGSAELRQRQLRRRYRRDGPAARLSLRSAGIHERSTARSSATSPISTRSAARRPPASLATSRSRAS